MKKSLAFFLAVLLMAVVFVPAAGAQVTVEEGYDYTRFAGEDVTLNVYNWGLYISDGTDDSMDVVKEFEVLGDGDFDGVRRLAFVALIGGNGMLVDIEYGGKTILRQVSVFPQFQQSLTNHCSTSHYLLEVL